MTGRCPDCSVTMETVEFGMSDAWQPYVKTGEQKSGLLGKLGINEREEVETLMCPECGLLRFYAAIEE